MLSILWGVVQNHWETGHLCWLRRIVHDYVILRERRTRGLQAGMPQEPGVIVAEGLRDVLRSQAFRPRWRLPSDLLHFEEVEVAVGFQDVEGVVPDVDEHPALKGMDRDQRFGVCAPPRPRGTKLEYKKVLRPTKCTRELIRYLTCVAWEDDRTELCEESFGRLLLCMRAEYGSLSLDLNEMMDVWRPVATNHK